MKVLHINYSDSVGGAAKACLRINEALRVENIESSVLTVEAKLNNQYVTSLSQKFLLKIWANFLFILEALIIKLNVKKNTVPFSTGIIGIDISKHKKVKEADVIHLHWINHGFLSLKNIKKLTSLNKPVFWTFHDAWLSTGGCHVKAGCTNYLNGCGNCPVLKNQKTNDLSKKLFKNKSEIIGESDFSVITPSKWLSNEVKQSSILKNKTVSVVNNPIDTNLYLNADKSKAKQTLNINTEKKVILFGFIKFKTVSHKGIDYLMEAFELLKQTAASKDILIMGLGLSEGDIKKLPFESIFTGYVKDENKLSVIYNAADVFVAPYLEDNFPNTVLESLSCGTPVVGFNTGGIPEMVDHKKNGYIANYKSAEDLANGITFVLNNPYYKILSDNARKKVEDNFSYKIIAQKYIALYNQKLNKTV